MFLGRIVRMGGFTPSKMSKMFLLLLVSLFSGAESNCKDSKPFYIKNWSTKTTKPYLTVDEDTSGVNGAAKTGKPDQQWMWRECEGVQNKDIVNVATGECLSIKGKKAKVSTKCEGKYSWIYGQTYGTLELFLKNKWTWLRLVKNKAAVKTSKQRWKNVQILQIHLCYFFWAVLIFWLYMRKQTKTLCYYHCAKSNMLKLLCY